MLNISTPKRQNFSLSLFLYVGKPESSGSCSPVHTGVALFIYWLCFSEYPYCDLQRCGDCVSEMSLLRKTNANSIFQGEALLPDFDMLLCQCSEEGEVLCRAAHL